jgi:predicted dehydrogenase
MSSHDPVRFAVVGIQGYSRSHLGMVAGLAEAGRGRLAASMIIDKADHPEVVAQFEQQGVRVFGNYAEMLQACRDQVDVVTLPVPIYLHAPMAIAALHAGYHVLVEKPVAGSLAEVDDMIVARQESSHQCAVGFQQLYSPVFQALKEFIVTGRLGHVRRIAIAALWPRPRAYYARNEWAGKLFCDGHPVYDSPFNNALAHQIMNMLYLASPELNRAASPAQVQADLYRAYDIESFDTGCMRLRTDGDVEIFFAASHACATTVQPLMELEAEKATVSWQYDGDATVVYRDGTTETIAQDDTRAHMFDNVLAAVSGRAPQPLCTLEIGRTHVACIEAIHRSTSIATVRDEFVSQGQDGQRAIAGIEQATRQAFESARLFSELDVPSLT